MQFGVFQAQIEDPLEEPRPTQPHRTAARTAAQLVKHVRYAAGVPLLHETVQSGLLGALPGAVLREAAQARRPKAARRQRQLMAGTLSSRRGPAAVIRSDCPIAQRQLSTNVVNG